MPNETTRRDVLKGGLAVAGLSVLGIPEWAVPVLAQGAAVVPFTDVPENFNPNPSPTMRFLDTRTIDGPYTPRDQFFAIQHYGQPVVDPTTYRLKVTGLVDKPLSLSLDDLRSLGGSTSDFGYECSGNSPGPMQGLASNAQWTGVPVSTILREAGAKPEGQEVVFFGADRQNEDVEFRGRTFPVEQQFGRSLTLTHAQSGDPFLAYEMNGEPLSVQNGAPVRLIVPGWYGVANVKYLVDIHTQADRYLGKFMARWYRTLRGEMIGGEMKWVETAVTRMNIKSVIARVTAEQGAHKVLGFVLNDGTPLRSVEVKVDDGPWQPAMMDGSTTGKYSWKLFTYMWRGATPGEHTLVSRATDVNGVVQPTLEELANKKTFLENNSQYPRTVMIS